MGSITVQLRGLGGSSSYTLDNENGDLTVADVRRAAGIAEGLVIRTDGSTVRDESGTAVRDEQVFVTAPPEAKHGSR